MGRGKEELKNMDVEFNTNIFTSESGREGEFIKGRFPRMEQEHKAILEEEVTIAETKMALKMRSWKVSGPDGYQPGFFQKNIGSHRPCSLSVCTTGTQG